MTVESQFLEDAPRRSEGQVFSQTKQSEVSDIFRPTAIPPVPTGTLRPFWSVMIPTYNRQDYLAQTLEGVLSQDPGPERMQLCVVDNATTTFDVRAMLQQLAGDRIEYIRHPVNIGGIRNINSCFLNSRGHWVHVLHDDDLVLPGFYKAFENAIAENPNAALLLSPVICMNEHGVANFIWLPKADAPGPIPDFLLHHALRDLAPTQSSVFARTTLERVGGYAEGLSMTPDWEMAFRAGTVGPVCTVGLPYAVQRCHEGSDTTKLLRGQKILNETKMLIDELCRRLPDDLKARLPKRRYQGLADLVSNYASTLERTQDTRNRVSLMWSVCYLDPSLRRLKALLLSLRAVALDKLKGRL